MLSSAVRGIVTVSDLALLSVFAEEPPCDVPGVEELPDVAGVSFGAGVAVSSPGFGVSSGVVMPGLGFGFGSGEGCVVVCLRRA